MTLESINRQLCDERDAYRSAALGLKARVAELERERDHANERCDIAETVHERRAARLVAEEREACARVATEVHTAPSAYVIADAIRARGGQ